MLFDNATASLLIYAIRVLFGAKESKGKRFTYHL